jgi:hypothetical protein
VFCTYNWDGTPDGEEKYAAGTIEINFGNVTSNRPDLNRRLAGCTPGRHQADYDPRHQDRNAVGKAPSYFYQKVQATNWVKAALSLPSNATIEDIKAEAKTPNPGSFVKALISFALVLAVLVGCFKVKDPVAKPAVSSAPSRRPLLGLGMFPYFLNDAGIVEDRAHCSPSTIRSRPGWRSFMPVSRRTDMTARTP